MQTVYKSYMNILNNLNSVQKAEEGQKKMIFGKPFSYQSGKWIPEGGAKEEDKKEEPEKKEDQKEIKIPKDSEGNILAPNGEKSNLNEKQYNHTRSPEFKSWFGDWEKDPENASKAIDDNGEPMIFYHGSSESFDEFDESKIGEGSGNYGHYGKGFYFSTDVLEAETYGDVEDFYINMEQPFITSDENIYNLGKKYGLDVPDKIPVGIDEKTAIEEIGKLGTASKALAESISKTGEWDQFINSYDDPSKAFEELKKEIEDPNDIQNIIDSTKGSRHNRTYEYIKPILEKYGLNPKIKEDYEEDPSILKLTDMGQYSDEFTKAIKAEGHDGILAGTETITFKPGQIKSATGNSGNFDPDSNNINKSTEDLMKSVYKSFSNIRKNLAGVHDALQKNGATTTTGTHSHSYLIDRDGNGNTTGMIGDSAVEHIHEIKNNEVLPAQDHIHQVI